jgi:hypothetical protein
MYIEHYIKVTVILVTFQRNLSFLDIFSKNIPVPNFMQIRPVGAELFHADGRTQTEGQTDRQADIQT